MMPIINQPVVRDYLRGNLQQEFPVADFINRQGFYVGVHPELSLDDMQKMGAIINQAIQKEVDRVYIK
jgi:dTDP-4-amino-4,6-dideoxygalactose transaminase